MNDDCAKYSPGAVLYVKVMEALREKGAKELNLGEGGRSTNITSGRRRLDWWG